MTSSEDESPWRCCWEIFFNLFWMKLSLRNQNNISELLRKLRTAFEKSQIFILYIYNQMSWRKSLMNLQIRNRSEGKCTTVVM